MHFKPLIFALATTLFSTTAFAQSAAPTRIRGDIVAVEGNVLDVKSREGERLKIRLTETVAVNAVVKASLADIKPGTYVGTAAMPQKDGPSRAIEVLIFPEAMRGAGEGDRSWDLQPESTMTNATIAETVQSVDGPVMTLKYKDGEKKISIPKDAPLVTFVSASVVDLKVGETIFISATKQADGIFETARVTVSRDGVKPPM